MSFKASSQLDAVTPLKVNLHIDYLGYTEPGYVRPVMIIDWGDRTAKQTIASGAPAASADANHTYTKPPVGASINVAESGGVRARVPLPPGLVNPPAPKGSWAARRRSQADIRSDGAEMAQGAPAA
jgi:hypothetical protein